MSKLPGVRVPCRVSFRTASPVLAAPVALSLALGACAPEQLTNVTSLHPISADGVPRLETDTSARAASLSNTTRTASITPALDPTSPPLAMAQPPPSGAGAASSPNGALAKARQLRGSGNKSEALALLDEAAKKADNDPAITAERGLLALEIGQLPKARALLEKAVAAAPGDWRLRSALGAALASAGQHPDAQQQFAKALELAPDNPAILNNLALSYALDGKHDQAEGLLRRAASEQSAPPQTRQNLALLLGLNGASDEAQKISESTLPPVQARANVSYLKELTTKPTRNIAQGPKPAVGPAEPSQPVRAAKAHTGLEEPVYRLGGPSGNSE